MANKKHSLLVLVLLSLYLFSVFDSPEATKLSSNASNSSGHCIEIERKALIQFKGGLKDPSGRLSSWIGDNCCEWKGVSCSRRTGNVIQLDLRNPYMLTCLECELLENEAKTFNWSCLGGKINHALLHLKHLEYLDLSKNNFQGIHIPNFFGSLRNLKYLNLSYAYFTGRSPPYLGNLSNLLYLDLQTSPYDYKSIWVSDLNWLSRLPSLKYLNLGSVNLSLASNDWLQAINMLPSLLELHLPSCDPHSFPQSLPTLNFTSLLVLNLYDNLLNSSIPHWLFNISNLVDLNLGESEIKGAVPNNAWSNFCNLQSLDLSFNEFSGGITSLTKCCNTSLEVLNLEYNNFNGQIPELLEHFRSLRSLLVKENSFSGSIPTLIERLSLLEELDLSYNNFNGTIPESTGQFKVLAYLSLAGNSFTGSIPSSIGRLSLLEELNLSDNKFNGIVPESIGQLKALAYLYLDGNSWKGIISEIHFLTLKDLKDFSISSINKALTFEVRHDWIPPFSLIYISITLCQLGPTFPTWLETQTELTEVILVNVGISGTIPSWLWKLSPQLGWLEVHNNQLVGALPKSLIFSPLGSALVDLSSNFLEGPVPMFSNVEGLFLSNNKLSGPIPQITGLEMSMLRSLDLSGNSLDGQIPSSLSKIKRLKILNLSNNKLSGKINMHWQGLKNLGVIDLSKNNLSGGIPSSICSPSHLYVMKLSSNNLSGGLSESLQNCTGLWVLDLEDNKFTGKLPNWIGKKLMFVRALNLRHNMFSGSIPENLCQLANLHILELAENNLSGPIPTCLGNLSRMGSFRPYYAERGDGGHVSYLQEMVLIMKGNQLEYNKTLDIVNIIDLSGNNLQGDIPEGITNLSYLVTLNLSQNQLTGKIPEKIRNLKLLETLDLSCNHLSGPIPLSMSSMTFLNYLNLSYNNLSGPIPSTNQFQTFIDPSIYEGNPELCGPPLPTNCSMPNSKDEEKDDSTKVKDGSEMIWFYSGMALGFVLGFWGVCGTLILKKSWRHAYFRFVDRMKDRIYVVIAVNIARLQRKLNSNN